MIAFEVYINGQKKFTAGGEDYQSLNALLGLIRLPSPKPDDVRITFMASAITPQHDRVGIWPTLEVAIGDRVEIRVVDVTNVDSPESVQALERSNDDNI